MVDAAHAIVAVVVDAALAVFSGRCCSGAVGSCQVTFRVDRLVVESGLVVGGLSLPVVV